MVAFTVPLKTDALTAPPDEVRHAAAAWVCPLRHTHAHACAAQDERPRKRTAVPAGTGSALSTLLPKPVHDDLGGFASTGGTKVCLCPPG